MDLSCPLWGAATTESVKSWKNGQKYWNCLGKTDKMPPFYIGKEDKDILKTSDFIINWYLKTSDFFIKCTL